MKTALHRFIDSNREKLHDHAGALLFLDWADTALDQGAEPEKVFIAVTTFNLEGETMGDKERQQLDQWAQYVRRGGSLAAFAPADVKRLQDWALDIKDIKLYDYLEKFWRRV